MQSRRFTLDDQLAFSKLSGDNNPLHLDPVAARRYIFGRPVVHGIHLVLWALENYAREAAHPFKLTSLNVQFQRPVGVEEEVEYSVTHHGQKIEFNLSSHGALSCRIKAQISEDPDKIDSFLTTLPPAGSPRVLKESDLITTKGKFDLHFQRTAAAELFPALIDKLSSGQIATLLATTRLVGVECPGLNSVYFELSLTQSDTPASDQFTYEVTRFEESLRIIVMRVTAPGLTGTVKAFVRPPRHEQTSYADIQKLVRPGQFKGQRALVIGGSRGLGEITAKLLCSGGAEVKITYNKGEEDAIRVVREVTAAEGKISALKFDLRSTDLDPFQKDVLPWAPTHLYYFATPFIFIASPNFNADIFQQFCDFYVTGFSNLVTTLVPQGLTHILYPSSIAINEVPLNMGEYAAAKAAGETLCAFLEKRYKGLLITRPRLPRMATDQTVSLRPVDNADPVPIILDAVHSLCV